MQLFFWRSIHLSLFTVNNEKQKRKYHLHAVSVCVSLWWLNLFTTHLLLSTSHKICPPVIRLGSNRILSLLCSLFSSIKPNSSAKLNGTPTGLDTLWCKLGTGYEWLIIEPVVRAHSDPRPFKLNSWNCVMYLRFVKQCCLFINRLVYVAHKIWNLKLVVRLNLLNLLSLCGYVHNGPRITAPFRGQSFASLHRAVTSCLPIVELPIYVTGNQLRRTSFWIS